LQLAEPGVGRYSRRAIAWLGGKRRLQQVESAHNLAAACKAICLCHESESRLRIERKVAATGLGERHRGHSERADEHGDTAVAAPAAKGPAACAETDHGGRLVILVG
jgi:hypothetical protein